METITQTNRTLLFAEINPERKNILTLIGDVRGKSSLDDDKMKEINEELLVSSFDEFLEKTRPVVYGCLGEEEKRRRYDEGRKRESSSDVGNASHGTQKTVSRSSGQRENTTFSNQSQFEQFFGFQPRKGMETYQHPKDRVQRNQEPICPEELFGRFFGRVDGKRGGEKG